MNIHEISIGEVKLKNNVFLAPMAGITDMPFRKICKDFGAGLVYTEMISSKGIEYNDKKTKELMKIDDNERPVAVQIFGSNPDIISNVVEIISNESDIIDINMGCPAPKVIKNKEGAALMLDEKLIDKITKKAVEKSKVPVTIKIRKGWNDININAVDIAKIAENNGIAAITVHGRTREEFYSGRSDLDIIKNVKNNVKIPVIGNGDIIDNDSARIMFEYTGCDGIMIGRGALGNPWIFDNIINNNKCEKNVEDMINKHLDMLIEYKGEYTAIREMRKHIAWYIKGMKDSSEMRNKVNQIENIKELKEELKEYFK